MKLTPFAVIYGGSLPQASVVLASTKTLVSGLVAQLNAAITEVNTNFANYGYAATPNLPAIPAIPAPGTSAPQAIAYFQSAAPGIAGPNYGPASSFLLIDAFTANGYSDPSAALDTLTNDTVLSTLQIALANLSQAAAVAITVQPTNQSIAAAAAGSFALTATGAGATYQWYIQLPNTSGFVALTALNQGSNAAGLGAAVFSGFNTNTLVVTRPVLATYNGAKIKCVVQSVSGGQSLASNTVTLTVT